MDRGPEVLGKREDATLGWGPLAAELEIHDVPTGHMSMLFAPNVETFAQMLKAVLPSGAAHSSGNHNSPPAASRAGGALKGCASQICKFGATDRSTINAMRCPA